MTAWWAAAPWTGRTWARCWCSMGMPETAPAFRAATTPHMRPERGRLGATLTLLCKGADAPLVQMQSRRIVDAVKTLLQEAR